MVLLQSGGAVQRNINLPLFFFKELYLGHHFCTVLNAHYIIFIILAACNYALISSAISILPDETVTILVINSSITDWFILFFPFKCLGSCVGWGCTICTLHPSPSVWVCPGSWYRWRVAWKDCTYWWRLEMAVEPSTFQILVPGKIFSSYWIRLSRTWRIMQIKEDVRPRWITFSEVCRILHIIQKLISIIVLLLHM